MGSSNGVTKVKPNRLIKSSDQALLTRSRQGDREAFGELYSKYLDAIYRYIFFRVNQNREEAEDLTEIVFFKAWEHIKKYHANGKTLKAWLYTIAHNSVIDHWRKRKRFLKLDEAMADPRLDLESALVRNGVNEKLLQAVDMLTDDQKQVVILKFIEGVDNKQLVGILNKKEDAIRALQHRALKRLRSLLESNL